MVSPFQKRSLDIKEKKRLPNGSPFKQRAKEKNLPQEPWYKSMARTLYQIPSGIAQATTYPMDIFNILATGGALDEEGIQELERAAERSGIPFNRDEYINAVMQQSQYIPTQSNIERMVEEQTGLPLTPQTGLQKGIKFASTGAGFTPGSLSQKTIGGLAAEGVKEGLEYVGVPETLAEIVALPTGTAIGSKAPAISATKMTKPSGLTTRKFEEVKTPTKVAQEKISKINEKVETEFKGIADKIFEESPIYDVQSALKEGPLYKQSVVDEFKKVQALADELPETISSKDITKRLSDKVSPKREKGFMDSEADKAYKKVVQDLIKESPSEDIPITAGKLVEQYRKNNEELGKLFEPGQSKAYNSGKAEAYLDYNKAIAETIEEMYPNSEFSSLFKESNKKWSQIKDAEAISEYMDKLFEGGKVNFKEAIKAFESKRLSISLERALGKKGYSDFKQLVNDLVTLKNPLTNLKAFPEKSLKDYLKSFLPFLLHPKIGATKLAYEGLQAARQGLWEFMLDKPKYRLEWKKGIQALKNNDPIKAKRIFDELKEDVKKVAPEVIESIEIVPKETPTPKEKAVKKYNEKKKSAPKVTAEPKSEASPSKNVENEWESFQKFGKGMTDDFYKKAFEALKKGSSKVSGIEEPILKLAKDFYQKGQIKNPEDLKRFYEQIYQSKKSLDKSFLESVETQIKETPTPKEQAVKKYTQKKKAMKTQPIKGYHGTQNKFTEFSRGEDYLGPHFTVDKKTAKIFAEEGESLGKSGRIIEADLHIKNPLEMPDMGGWNPYNVAKWIDEHGLTKFKADAKGNLGELETKVFNGTKNIKDPEKIYKVGNSIVKKFLRSKGYDSIKYKNTFEGEPVDSYIILNRGDIKQKLSELVPPKSKKSNP